MSDKFKIEALKDSKGIYGLEFKNTIGGWFGSRQGNNYIYLVRPDALARERKHLNKEYLIPELFHTLPFKDAGWCKKTTEHALFRLCMETICRERNLDIIKGLQEHQDKKEYWQKFWGFRNIAWKLLNSRLKKVYSEALPEYYLKLIRRYPIKYRQDLFKHLCIEGERAWQLADVFPALALYVYLILDEPAEKSELSAMVREGAKLKDIARAARVPLGFRHFPPATLNALCSKAGSLLSNHPRLIDNHAPATVPKMRAWLGAINSAYHKTENIEFVKWTARNALKLGHFREVASLIQDISDFVKAGEVNALIRQVDQKQYALIKKLESLKSNYALMENPELFQEDPLIHRPFNPYLAARTLKALSDEWHEAVAKIEAEKVQFPDPWYSGGKIRDYVIEPIADHVQLTAAAKRFRNCASTYSRNIAGGHCFLYTVSNGKKDMAMFELERGNPPTMTEIKGPCNSKVDAKTTRAARQWLRESVKAEGNGRLLEMPEQRDSTWADVPF